ncbi:MAG TPA: G5 domain-containing protein [Candidatus Saccharimonadales bacterium]|nr:G5 domain-containing protein [Candidatus Saccharimonadales bacterium]
MPLQRFHKHLKKHHQWFFTLKGHPFFIPVTTFLVLFIATAVILVSLGGQTVGASDNHVVIVTHDNKQETVPTRAVKVSDLLDKLGVHLEKGDVVEPTVDTPIVEDNFRVNVYRARPVTIVDGSQVTHAYNAGQTARNAASEAGLTVYPEDDITRQPVQDVLKDGIGEKIVINRAVPANLNLYGTPVTIRTHSKTVGDLLKEKNVQLAKDDQVQPAVTTPVTPSMQVFVVRAGTQIATQEEAIAAPSETIEDPSLSFGTTVVRQNGVAGKKLVTYQIETQNGKEVARHVIQEVTVIAPVKQVIARGKVVSIPEDKTVVMAAAGIKASDYAYVNYIISHESGWCPTKLQGQIGYCPAYPPSSIPSGLGYGLGQATPGSKMSPFGSDWTSNPVTQLRWATSYADARFGSWGAAYNYWQAHHNW